jgi:hypothetical protein
MYYSIALNRMFTAAPGHSSPIYPEKIERQIRRRRDLDRRREHAEDVVYSYGRPTSYTFARSVKTRYALVSSDPIPHLRRPTSMSTATPELRIEEGIIPFTVGDDTFSIWYKIFGILAGRTARQLVVLHSGPGLTHDYLLPYTDLAQERLVIFCDQLGNGH